MSQKSPCVKQMTEPKHRQPRFRQHRPPPTSEHADKMIDLSFHSQTMLTISCQTTEKVPPYITFLIIILKAIMSLYVYTPKNSFSKIVLIYIQPLCLFTGFLLQWRLKHKYLLQHGCHRNVSSSCPCSATYLEGEKRQVSLKSFQLINSGSFHISTKTRFLVGTD